MLISNLVNYRIAYPSVPLPPIEANLYEYILAENGVFVRGERREFAALLPIKACEIRGLAGLEPHVELRVPCVPSSLLLMMLDRSRKARDSNGFLIEILFHLWVDEAGAWQLETPEQSQGFARAKPIDDSPTSSYAHALLEVHSHAELPARFSSTDDGDELGFRLFGVLGDVLKHPQLRVRVGLYGYRWEMPAQDIFELTPDIVDALEMDTEMESTTWRNHAD
jgi:hypothetical protein